MSVHMSIHVCINMADDDPFRNICDGRPPTRSRSLSTRCQHSPSVCTAMLVKRISALWHSQLNTAVTADGRRTWSVMDMGIRIYKQPCMCACVDVCIDMCIDMREHGTAEWHLTSTHMSTHVHVYKHRSAHMSTHAHVPTHACLHTCRHTRRHTCLHTCLCAPKCGIGGTDPVAVDEAVRGPANHIAPDLPGRD